MVPMMLYAKGIVACGAVDGSEPVCDFNGLLATANKLIEFLLVYFATPLAAMIFAYAGFIYLTSGGNSNKVGQAKKIMLNMLIGYLIALCAWLIVNTIFKTLGYTGPTFI